MRWYVHFTIIAILIPFGAQPQIHVEVDASAVIGTVNALWGDHYDVQLLHGAGGNPTIVGPKELYIDDPGFESLMTALQPRSIRVSVGRYDDPPSASFYSSDTAVLRNLWTEWYHGPNTMAGVNDPGNFDFTYIDSLVDVVQRTGAEPYVELGAMPFDLSSVQIPAYAGCVGWPIPCHIYSWDNAIRTAPPANNAVYGRAAYQLIKHLHTTRGVVWFEVWNEPDQTPGLTPFWDGTQTELNAMYAAIAAEVDADPVLSPAIKLGCCSFAMQSFLYIFPTAFLQTIQQQGSRFDFLSFHPYAAQNGGYDTVKAELARTWRDQYVPNADLVNAEWGILAATFGSAGWNSLDYGLDRIKATIDMQDRDIRLAHAASMTDNDTTATSCCLGMFYAKPEFSAKPAAYAYMAMNMVLGATDRLHANVSTSHAALSCATPDQDTVYVIVPADDPNGGQGSVSMVVNDLPWNTGHATRHELTMTSYSNGEVLVPIAMHTILNGGYADSLVYMSDQDNGRLVIWELVRDDDMGLVENEPTMFTVSPNPSVGEFILRSMDGTVLNGDGIRIIDVLGREVRPNALSVTGTELRFVLSIAGTYTVLHTASGQAIRLIVP